jgi:hypothetical protein
LGGRNATAQCCGYCAYGGIIFDRRNELSAVPRIVLVDGHVFGDAGARLQRSIQWAIAAGDYAWKAMRTGGDGIQPEGRR